MYLRRDMQRAEYSATPNEWDTTVTYVIRDLASRPTLRNIVPTLVMPACNPNTIQKLKETWKELGASQAIKCAPKARGTGTKVYLVFLSSPTCQPLDRRMPV